VKPLGALDYHKAGCQAVAFARPLRHTNDSHIEGDDEMTAQEKEERCRWLVGGGKDGRISVWTLMSFQKT
jgi:hypothetical protein